jgi:hypothetical protein
MMKAVDTVTDATTIIYTAAITKPVSLASG